MRTLLALAAIPLLGCQEAPLREHNLEGPFGDNHLILVGVLLEYPESLPEIRRTLKDLVRIGYWGEDGDSNLGITELLFPERHAKAATEILLARSKNSEPRWFRSLDEWAARDADERSYDDPFSRAQRYLRSRDYSFAIAHFTAALRARPDSWEAYAGRAEARQHRGEIQAAIADYEKAAAMDPSGGGRYRARAQRLQSSD